MWTIAGLADPGGGESLHLSPFELYLVGSRCGTLGGAWRADTDGVFLASVDSASSDVVEGTPGCARASQETPGWLRRVTAYRFDGNGLPVLLDDLAQPVARLVPGTTATAWPDLAPFVLEPPMVTDESRRSFAPAVPLPAALTPVDPQRLAGRWVPTRGHRGAYLEFTADGGWRGSDGCNDQNGRWITADGGTLLATAGAVTLAACAARVPVGYWLWEGRRAGFDGDTLVLLDGRGTETGRLHPVG
ncbi:META domain-containing protein [Micromonospora cathayae]|uniref:META domain-containing protein n=1 Tax=Micromonospora cathayae TaxID=3028804 RepID=A0ABY7ZQ23_9ACTN|nr:META domain-containing protein [Micromonospora sp. HUAS 3]WDZ84059.1 META domain-containing protein [Micromonospora sp. HUAS 3]